MGFPKTTHSEILFLLNLPNLWPTISLSITFVVEYLFK